MDAAAATRCTRFSFGELARRRCAESPWELRAVRDALGTAVEWLEATYALGGASGSDAGVVLATVCVLFNPDYAVPQLGLYTSTAVSTADLEAAVPRLAFVGVASSAAPLDADGVSRRPLVSFSWSEELGRHAWLVHPCDTENLLRCRRYDGERDDVVTLFLRTMANYFPFAGPLLPRTSGATC
ncbi:autophagy protein 10 (ATG10) [Novymonas esmeraldas]|uniref:Autophagy protein 10 (ATG10) n=1 Tax=Novymonas esmeraldas TaxID=1808958 RepID=A0AAW0F0Y9_9TRYP